MLVISDQKLFRYRSYENMEVRLWDYNQKAWGSPLADYLWTISDDSLIIRFDDDNLLPFDLKTKVMISFF
jgi:hypothetical protein